MNNGTTNIDMRLAVKIYLELRRLKREQEEFMEEVASVRRDLDKIAERLGVTPEEVLRETERH